MSGVFHAPECSRNCRWRRTRTQMREVPCQPLQAAHSIKSPALPEDAYSRAKSANMADYYTVLSQKIQETRDDPVKMRGVVYEAARLALKWQVQKQWPGLSTVQSKSHIRELEDAIARLEAEAAGWGGRGSREPPKAAAGLTASRQSRNPPIESETEDAPNVVAESRPRPWDDPLRGQADLVGSRKLNLVLPIKRAYVVNPTDFVNPDLTHRLSVAHSGARMAVSGLLIAFQLGVATLAVAAFYVAMWGRDSPVQTVKETPTAAAKPSGAWLTRPPDGSNAVVVASSDAVVAAPLAAAPFAAAPVDGGTLVVTAPLATAPVSFPRPTTYGVYAISDNRLIELEQVQATPVDPRAGNQFQIVEPGRSVMAAGTLAFVVFRRDLVSNAREEVPLRIAARVARSMNFDSSGKAVMTTPVTETWIVRDQGYNLRVSPLRENAEMVMLRSEQPGFSFPSGRYELMLAGQSYDFVVAGEVTDPAHCVEGVATVRGPVFYECKPVLGPLK
jgi:hypothetical protein